MVDRQPAVDLGQGGPSIRFEPTTGSLIAVDEWDGIALGSFVGLLGEGYL